MVEVEYRLINEFTQVVPIASGPVGYPCVFGFGIEFLNMRNLTRHTLVECFLAILRHRPYVNRVQALAFLVVKRNASCHGLAPLLVTQKHAGAIDYDPDSC